MILLASSYGGQGNFPAPTLPRNIGLEAYYVHGWDPGDPGQPTTGSSVDSAGNCKAWDFSGTVTTVDNLDGTSTVTRASGNYFGMTFSVGSTIYLGGTANTPFSGTAYVISSFDPSVANSVLKITGSITNTVAIPYNEANPPAQFTPGCGDDLEDGITFNCDNCWRENGYIEKIHWQGNESHSSLQGFSFGPYKLANNWEEGGACAFFSGGGAVDTNHGPENDIEMRRNYFGRPLSYRALSAHAGHSPSPPWGAGPEDNIASHNTSPFNWAIKNSVEFKIGVRALIDGNIIENAWADGQTGSVVLINVRVCSGGQACGVYDPVTHLPLTELRDLRFSNNWVRNAPQVMEQATRSGIPGDGGGQSGTGQKRDFINNLFSNIADPNQFGLNGGTWEWATGGVTSQCAMSGTGSTATGICQPFQADFTAKVTSIKSVLTGGQSIVTDPYLCLGLPATAAACLAAGQTVILSGAVGAWNGTFPIAGTNTNWNADGTGGNNASYTDNINNPGTATYCDNQSNGVPPNPPKCSGLGFTTTWASLAYKMTDILAPPNAPDNVYAADSLKLATVSNVASTATTATYTLSASPYTGTNPLFVGQTVSVSALKTANASLDCALCVVASVIGSSPQSDFTVTGTFTPIASNPDNGRFDDNTCSANGYAWTGPGSVLAAAGTITTGLTVKFPSTGTARATCAISNTTGFPKFATMQNNTFLAQGQFSVNIFNNYQQSLSNSFFNNVWANTDAGHNSDLYCSSGSTEGTASFACFDSATFQSYHNLMQGRTSSNWSVASCPGGTCTNAFPTTVNCATNTADATCLGYSGFMGSSPTVTYPTVPCVYDGSDPTNCPLMALPWKNNFALSNVSYDGSSSYSTYGVDTSKMTDAMTKSKYVCPTGANCGATGPFQD
jgi:hypothetical protein